MRPILAFLFAAFAMPAAAHDAPLALVEALQDHLRDCPAANGYRPDAGLLSEGWKPRTAKDAILADRAADFTAPDKSDKSSVNIFTKQVQGFEVIQFMGLRTVAGPEVAEPQEDPENPDNNASATFLCATLIPDLPFMPRGELLGAVFGEDVQVSFENTPKSRDGLWIWDDLSPTHKRTIARFTDSYSDLSDLPDDIFYPGFYILSFYQFTSGNQTQESDQK